MPIYFSALILYEPPPTTKAAVTFLHTYILFHFVLIVYLGKFYNKTVNIVCGADS